MIILWTLLFSISKIDFQINQSILYLITDDYTKIDISFANAFCNGTSLVATSKDEQCMNR